jgi:hypothetical protein
MPAAFTDHPDRPPCVVPRHGTLLPACAQGNMVASGTTASEGSVSASGTPIRQGARALKTRLTIDRFEGDRKQVAVLLTDDGTQINFPKALLPKGVRAGDILSFTIEKDAEATEKVARETRVVQDDLKKTDPGGDISV